MRCLKEPIHETSRREYRTILPIAEKKGILIPVRCGAIRYVGGCFTCTGLQGVLPLQATVLFLF